MPLPTSHAAGQVIAAADVNAIAAAVNGLSNYTDEQVRDVIGAALVAGSNVTITVNDPGDTITIASTGGGGAGGAGRGCRVFHSAALTAPDATLIAIPWNSESYDTDTMHSTSSNQSRMVAPVTGLYLINAVVRWSAAFTAALRVLQIQKNAAVIVESADTTTGSTDTNHISDVVSLTAGDYIEIAIYQNSGASRTTIAGSAYTFASMTLMVS